MNHKDVQELLQVICHCVLKKSLVNIGIYNRNSKGVLGPPFMYLTTFAIHN